MTERVQENLAFPTMREDFAVDEELLSSFSDAPTLLEKLYWPTSDTNIRE